MAAPTITGTPLVESNATVYTWNGSSFLRPFTHVSGDDLFVWFGESYEPRGADPTGVTWNGIALTKIANKTNTGAAGVRGTWWRLIAAAGTTHDIVVSFGSADTALGTFVALSANGVVSLGTPVTSECNGGDSSTLSVTLAGDADHLMLAACTFRKNPYSTIGAVTATSNGTDLGNSESYANTLCDRTVVFTKAGGASVAMTATMNHADIGYGIMVGIPLQGASSGGGGAVHPLVNAAPLASLVNGGLVS